MSPDSTIVLTKRALGEVGGTLQQIQWRRNAAILSTRYTKNRRGPGTSEIAIVATVGRKVTDPMHPETIVELRAWALDSLAVRRQLGAAITTVDTRLHRPRAITLDDSDDWASVELVMQILVERGAKRIPE